TEMFDDFDNKYAKRRNQRVRPAVLICGALTILGLGIWLIASLFSHNVLHHPADSGEYSESLHRALEQAQIKEATEFADHLVQLAHDPNAMGSSHHLVNPHPFYFIEREIEHSDLGIHPEHPPESADKFVQLAASKFPALKHESVHGVESLDDFADDHHAEHTMLGKAIIEKMHEDIHQVRVYHIGDQHWITVPLKDVGYAGIAVESH
ncbi:hypothetical protein GQ42DRAFT_159773, partial [Ramicandelaber brevisporus]